MVAHLPQDSADRSDGTPSDLTLPPDQVLLAVLGLAVLTNIALVGVIQYQNVRRRRARSLAQAERPLPTRPMPEADDEDAQAAAAIEAFISGDGIQVQPPAPAPAAAPRELAHRAPDVQEVPVPDDPVTGKPFEYKVSGERATLFGPSPVGDPRDPAYALTYELTLKR